MGTEIVGRVATVESESQSTVSLHIWLSHMGEHDIVGCGVP